MDCRLKHVIISNFKSLKRVELDDLGNLALFMGRNNAGKSNILDAFKFVADASVSLDEAVNCRGGKLTEVIFRKQETGRIEFLFEFALSWTKRAEFIVRLFSENRLTPPEAVIASNFLSVLRLKISLTADHYFEELTVPNLSPEYLPALLFSVKGTKTGTEAIAGCLETACTRCSKELLSEQIALETPSAASTPFRLRLGRPEAGVKFPISYELADLVYQQFATLDWIDPLRRLPSSAPIQGGLVIAADASNLPDVLHWLHNNKPKQFRKIEAEVGKLVPQLGRLYTPTHQNAATLGLIDSEDEDLVFSMEQMSFGTRSLVAIVAKVVTAKPGAWVCVEEPETYLHPQAQMGLFHFLKVESAKKRIFVATHSTFIAASCQINSLFIVHRDRGNCTVASPVTEITALEVIEQLGVKPSFSFEAEAIVFVEDNDTIPVCDAWAKRYGLGNKTQFMDVEGASTLHYFANSRVASSKFVNTMVFAIFGGGGNRTESARRTQKNVVTHLQLPATQIVTLEMAELEGYLLDPKAILKAFPAISLPESELESRFAPARMQPGVKDVLRELFNEFRIGEYSGALGARIADAMETIPPQISHFFEQIDTDSKPFWKI